MSDLVRTFQTAVQNSAKHHCNVHLPYPLDIPVPVFTAKAPATFRLETNYKKKLEECKCNAIYQQYTKQQLYQTMERGVLSKLVPRFAIAPVNSDISYTTRIKPMTMTKIDMKDELTSAEDLPAYFNWADQTEIMSKVYSQGMCGSCWAIAAASCVSDVFAIQQGIKNPNLSPTYLLSCKSQSQCDGGDPGLAVEDIKKNGIIEEGCLEEDWCAPFTGCGGNTAVEFDPSTINSLIPKCACTQAKKKYYVKDSRMLCVFPDLQDFSQEEREIITEYFRNPSTELADLTALDYKQVQALIKRHIYTKGPVIGGFHVFNNFFRDDFAETNQIYVETQTYRGVPGVDYSDVQKSWAGSHAVVIMGWGREKIQDEDVDYWIVRNSWGVLWGNEGYFKMAMYGNDPDKKFQNRFSQFEYPSVIVTDEGIGLTGGVIMITPGKIEDLPKTITLPSGQSKVVVKIALSLLILFIRPAPIILVSVLLILWML